jgi:hypothetical protein
MSSAVDSPLPQAAFYYPGPMWSSDSWIKSATLFFDKIALLVPDYMKDRPHRLDPAIAAGLEDAGLLTILSPERLVDKAATERLAAELADVIASGVLDDLPAGGAFAELSMSRLGYAGDHDLAHMIFEELQRRGLARRSEDGVSIPLHPMVRSLVLVMLAQILKAGGPAAGLDLNPATDKPEVLRALSELIGATAPAGPGAVVQVDLEFVAPDLSSVPVDELLDFRARHGAEYKAYARGLRSIVRDLDGADPDQRAGILADRREALDATADVLRRGPLKDIVTTGAMALGVVAGIAGIAEGSTVSGAAGAAAALWGAAASAPRSSPEHFSYLFALRREMP